MERFSVNCGLLFKTIIEKQKENGIMGAKSPTNDCIPNGVFRPST